jgi:hypothetical protein
MTQFVFFIAALGMLILNSSCKDIRLPEVPEGTVLSQGMIVDIPNGFEVPQGCFQANPDRPIEYECVTIPRGWQVTSPRGYQILRDDIDAKYSELAKLRRRCKN